MSFYKIKKNKWKEISVHIPERSDNAIKNQFFALVRKGLRKACKSIGLTHNTEKVNTIKPKVLLDFFDTKYRFSSSEFSALVQTSEFIEKFAFYEDVSFMEKQNNSTEIINFLLQKLSQLKFYNKQCLFESFCRTPKHFVRKNKPKRVSHGFFD